MREKLVSIEEIAEQIPLPVRTVRTLMANGVIPFLKLGHRTIRFQPTKVERALARREVKAKNGTAE